ncbi:NADP-dependent phosphogluconate dehydrogenase [uncultured Georgenia sp.]|uniref:NADP-dependent phosphogluconate dehydrogenase n=1 Tax=uncultured Georgenia sp. TaxID=378209 RepID=UPI0026282EBC|nr:NADP-dependent phosphogluconate dehydrogenase [uncultured Georgenia sp.]HLV03849.1 NADP-dependent phosphogluconate dehydrogenase [Actinomycetaceae bacterium]
MTATGTTASAQIGVIGLAVMGSNLARNFARNGYTVALYNRTTAKTDEVVAAYGHEGTFVPSATLEEFVASLERPRKMIIMVKAGGPTDAVIDSLVPLLEEGDIVVDGGNAHYEDTRRREKALREVGLHFVGAGISGGEEGALNGPSIMPGGPAESYETLGPILESIAAKYDGEPCCVHIGPDGAGHFVKMVHNGIEYADMQFIAEAYDILRSAGIEPAELAEIFEEWNSGDLDSYLIEITAEVLRHVDAATGRPFVDIVADAAAQKGTGRWTVQIALELGVPVNTIAESVFARSTSGHASLRAASRAALTGPQRTPVSDADRAALVESVRQALWSSKVIAYAQGLDQIRTASEEFGWDVDIAAVAKIWRAGCIIRARLLERIRSEYAAHNLTTLLEAPSVAEGLKESQEGWRAAVSHAVANGVPVPGFSAALAYYDTVRAERLPAALVQGQRDFFGAHTYHRVDREGVFHTEWSGDRSETEQG